ncbi:MAG: beta/gamma crystallin-related protein [Acidobacteriota bacterium]
MTIRPTPLWIFLLAALVALPVFADEGAVLFDGENFRGTSEFFDRDVPNLVGSRLGNDRARSIQVDRGCRVTLYEDRDFRGRSTTVARDRASLGGTEVGLDEVSSLRVRCRGGGGWGDDGWGDGGWGGGSLPRGSGVVVYEHEDFRGRSQAFERDVRSLAGTRIGNDRASSIQVAPGCEAILYRDRDFRGVAVRLDGDERDLGRTRLGNDGLTSIEISCRGGGGGDWGWSSGVVLYEDRDYRGRSESFERGVRSLEGSRVGNDRVTSIRVAPGCSVVLYEDRDYRGRSVRLDRDVSDLGRTRLGNDRLTSFEVECRGGSSSRPPWGGGGGSRGVVLYEHDDFRGRSVVVDRDIADLGRTSLGNDRASSVRIPRGCSAILYRDAGFRGSSVRLDGDERNLGRTRVGNDAVTSIEVRCRGRR